MFRGVFRYQYFEIMMKHIPKTLTMAFVERSKLQFFGMLRMQKVLFCCRAGWGWKEAEESCIAAGESSLICELCSLSNQFMKRSTNQNTNQLGRM